MELLSIDTLDELEEIRKFRQSHIHWLLHEFFVNGRNNESRSIDNWYWQNNGQKIAFDIPWNYGEPNDGTDVKRCLVLILQDEALFNDVRCVEPWSETLMKISFICQKLD
ncbi:hypothetical protein PVAND_004685 [Polypedilum vanderplanki]|uniref:C-type lectin domain-containing protein n=1 Tax=Polypedilum vanderplanki TaxID=319348 RepID=A0A9J6BZU3_POLVA|nr:hypothetical protein PVAND_004685 [Polypedilum vanderplanki]